MSLFGYAVANDILVGSRMMDVKDALLRIKSLRLYASETILAICPNFRVLEISPEIPSSPPYSGESVATLHSLCSYAPHTMAGAACVERENVRLIPALAPQGEDCRYTTPIQSEGLQASSFDGYDYAAHAERAAATCVTVCSTTSMQAIKSSTVGKHQPALVPRFERNNSLEERYSREQVNATTAGESDASALRLSAPGPRETDVLSPIATQPATHISTLPGLPPLPPTHMRAEALVSTVHAQPHRHTDAHAYAHTHHQRTPSLPDLRHDVSASPLLQRSLSLPDANSCSQPHPLVHTLVCAQDLSISPTPNMLITTLEHPLASVTNPARTPPLPHSQLGAHSHPVSCAMPPLSRLGTHVQETTLSQHAWAPQPHALHGAYGTHANGSALMTARHLLPPPILPAVPSLCPGCGGGSSGYVMSEPQKQEDSPIPLTTNCALGASADARLAVGDPRVGPVRALPRTPVAHAPSLICPLCRCLRDCVLLTCTRLVAVQGGAVTSDLWLHGVDAAQAVPLLMPPPANPTLSRRNISHRCSQDTGRTTGPAVVANGGAPRSWVLLVRGTVRWDWSVLTSLRDSIYASASSISHHAPVMLHHTSLAYPSLSSEAELLVRSSLLQMPSHPARPAHVRVWPIYLTRLSTACFLAAAPRMIARARQLRLHLMSRSGIPSLLPFRIAKGALPHLAFAPACCAEPSSPGISSSFQRRAGGMPLLPALQQSARVLLGIDKVQCEHDCSRPGAADNASHALPRAADVPKDAKILATTAEALVVDHEGFHPVLALNQHVWFESSVTVRVELRRMNCTTNSGGGHQAELAGDIVGADLNANAPDVREAGRECSQHAVAHRTRPAVGAAGEDLKPANPVPITHDIIAVAASLRQARAVHAALVGDRLLLYQGELGRLTDVVVSEHCVGVEDASSHPTLAYGTRPPPLAASNAMFEIAQTRTKAQGSANVGTTQVLTATSHHSVPPTSSAIARKREAKSSPENAASARFSRKRPSAYLGKLSTEPSALVPYPSLRKAGSHGGQGNPGGGLMGSTQGHALKVAGSHDGSPAQTSGMQATSELQSAADNSDPAVRYPVLRHRSKPTPSPALPAAPTLLAALSLLPPPPVAQDSNGTVRGCVSCRGVRLSHNIALLVTAEPRPSATTASYPMDLAAATPSVQSAWRGVCVCAFSGVTLSLPQTLCLALPIPRRGGAVATGAFGSSTIDNSARNVPNSGCGRLSEDVCLIYLSCGTGSLRDAWACALFDAICAPLMRLPVALPAIISPPVARGPISPRALDLLARMRVCLGGVAGDAAVAKATYTRSSGTMQPPRIGSLCAAAGGLWAQWWCWVSCCGLLTEGSRERYGERRLDMAGAAHSIRAAGTIADGPAESWALSATAVDALREVLRAWTFSRSNPIVHNDAVANQRDLFDGSLSPLRVTAACDGNGAAGRVDLSLSCLQPLLDYIDSHMPTPLHAHPSPLRALPIVNALSVLVAPHVHEEGHSETPPCAEVHVAMLDPVPAVDQALVPNHASRVWWAIDGRVWARSMLWRLLARLVNCSDNEASQHHPSAQGPAGSAAGDIAAAQGSLSTSFTEISGNTTRLSSPDAATMPSDSHESASQRDVVALRCHVLPPLHTDRDVVAVSLACTSGGEVLCTVMPLPPLAQGHVSDSLSVSVSVELCGGEDTPSLLAANSLFADAWSPHSQPTAPTIGQVEALATPSNVGEDVDVAEVVDVCSDRPRPLVTSIMLARGLASLIDTRQPQSTFIDDKTQGLAAYPCHGTHEHGTDLGSCATVLATHTTLSTARATARTRTPVSVFHLRLLEPLLVGLQLGPALRVASTDMPNKLSLSALGKATTDASLWPRQDNDASLAQSAVVTADGPTILWSVPPTSFAADAVCLVELALAGCTDLLALRGTLAAEAERFRTCVSQVPLHALAAHYTYEIQSLPNVGVLPLTHTLLAQHTRGTDAPFLWEHDFVTGSHVPPLQSAARQQPHTESSMRDTNVSALAKCVGTLHSTGINDCGGGDDLWLSGCVLYEHLRRVAGAAIEAVRADLRAACLAREWADAVRLREEREWLRSIPLQMRGGLRGTAAIVPNCGLCVATRAEETVSTRLPNSASDTEVDDGTSEDACIDSAEMQKAITSSFEALQAAGGLYALARELADAEGTEGMSTAVQGASLSMEGSCASLLLPRGSAPSCCAIGRCACAAIAAVLAGDVEDDTEDSVRPPAVLPQSGAEIPDDTESKDVQVSAIAVHEEISAGTDCLTDAISALATTADTCDITIDDDDIRSHNVHEDVLAFAFVFSSGDSDWSEKTHGVSQIDLGTKVGLNDVFTASAELSTTVDVVWAAVLAATYAPTASVSERGEDPLTVPVVAGSCHAAQTWCGVEEVDKFVAELGVDAEISPESAAGASAYDGCAVDCGRASLATTDDEDQGCDCAPKQKISEVVVTASTSAHLGAASVFTLLQPPIMELGVSIVSTSTEAAAGRQHGAPLCAADTLHRLTGRVRGGQLAPQLFSSYTPGDATLPETSVTLPPLPTLGLPAGASLGLDRPDCDTPLTKLLVRDATALIRDDYVYAGEDTGARGTGVVLSVPELVLTPTATLDALDVDDAARATSRPCAKSAITAKKPEVATVSRATGSVASKQREPWRRNKALPLADRVALGSWAR